MDTPNYTDADRVDFVLKIMCPATETEGDTVTMVIASHLATSGLQGRPLLDAAMAHLKIQPRVAIPPLNPGLSSLALWWAMHEAQWELTDKTVNDNDVLLQFMGSGGSHMVTAGDLRQAFNGVPKATPALNLGPILDWFKQAMPLPTDKNRAVQTGCHFEEVHEMAEQITADDHVKDMIKTLADYFKKQSPGLTIGWPEEVRLDLLDSLCDQIVTATGTAYVFGFDLPGALAEVNASNWSKFVDGKAVFDENGKIAKPPTHFKANLTPFLGPLPFPGEKA